MSFWNCTFIFGIHLDSKWIWMMLMRGNSTKQTDWMVCTVCFGLVRWSWAWNWPLFHANQVKRWLWVIPLLLQFYWINKIQRKIWWKSKTSFVVVDWIKIWCINKMSVCQLVCIVWCTSLIYTRGEQSWHKLVTARNRNRQNAVEMYSNRWMGCYANDLSMTYLSTFDFFLHETGDKQTVCRNKNSTKHS